MTLYRQTKLYEGEVITEPGQPPRQKLYIDPQRSIFAGYQTLITKPDVTTAIGQQEIGIHIHNEGLSRNDPEITEVGGEIFARATNPEIVHQNRNSSHPFSPINIASAILFRTY